MFKTVLHIQRGKNFWERERERERERELLGTSTFTSKFQNVVDLKWLKMIFALKLWFAKVEHEDNLFELMGGIYTKFSEFFVSGFLLIAETIDPLRVE